MIAEFLFGCFSFRVLVSRMLAHCHTVTAYEDRAIIKVISSPQRYLQSG